MSTITLRIARPSDAAALINIYAPYVLTTAITYEYDVPSLEDFTARIERTLQKFPYIVAERDGELLGYAYLSTYIGRAACAWSAEASIYLRSDAHGLGLGRRLYTALESVARAVNESRKRARGDLRRKVMRMYVNNHLGFISSSAIDRTS